MITPTEEQVIDRWDSLPDSLKDALTSTANSDLIWKIAGAEHVPDQKIYDVGRAVSHVLFGFIHPEDMTTELKESQLNPQTIAALVTPISQKIFAPLQQDLNRVYQPLINQPAAPKIMQEIKPPTISTKPSAPAAIPVPAAPSSPAPKILAETFVATGLATAAAPLAANKKSPVPAPQPAKPSFSNQGWSKQLPQEPVIKLGQVAPGVPTPTKPTAAPAIAPAPGVITAKPIASRVGNTMSEFDRLDMIKKVPTGANTAPSGPAAPVMLHEVSGSSAIKDSPNLHVAAGTRNQIDVKVPAAAAPTKPAVLEFGVTTPTTPPSSASKVVHYSEYKTPIPPAIPANAVPRQVTQVVAPAPVQVPTPQAVTTPPPAPPKPPQPTIAGAQKVIVKDFL